MSKVGLSIKHLCTHLLMKDNRVTCKLFSLISKTRAYTVIFVTALLYALGIIINSRYPFPKYTLFQSLFTGIFVVAFCSVKYYERQFKRMHESMSADKTLQQINDKIYRLRCSAVNLMIPPVVAVFFGILAANLIGVSIRTPSAVYLIFIYTICVVMSITGYLQYLYLCIYIKKLSSTTKTIRAYNKDYPSNTKWVILLTEVYSRYRNIFFLLGSSYVFGVIYFVLCDEFKVIEKLMSDQWQMLSLLLFWGSVFLAIVVVFPVSSVLGYNNIKKIIAKLKEQTIDDLNKTKHLYSTNLELEIQKSSLVIAITDTPDYPIKDKLGIIFSVLLTCLNTMASAVAILEYLSL